MVLIVPTIMALVKLWNLYPRTIIAVALGAWVLQGIFALEYLATQFDFYTIVGNVWLVNYPSLWGPLSRFMAALYNSSWVAGYAPNVIVGVLLLIAVAIGIFGIKNC